MSSIRSLLAAGVIAVAVVSVASVPGAAQAPGAAAAAKQRAVDPQLRAACKRQATAQKLTIGDRRAFVRRCLRG
ncbi:MAG: hypothetical protein K2Y71_21415 [Xanthobacteraceae bacterium]|nr:hypothetical protein [Xanthobacteraceae bacterium]